MDQNKSKAELLLDLEQAHKRIAQLEQAALEQAESERRQAESEFKFRSLYDSMVELSAIHELVYDASGQAVDYRIIDCNPAYERTLGIPRQRALGALASQLYGSSEPPYFEIYRNVAQSGRPVAFEADFAPMGKSFYISVFSPQKDRFVTVATDISERKQAEEKISQNEQKYRDLLNSMNDTAWVIGQGAAILDVNTAASRVLGYTREEFLSMKVSDIDFNLKPGQIQNLVDSIPFDVERVFETWHTAKDGRKLPVEISSSLVRYQGRPAIICIARDITERQRVDRALRESEAKYLSLIESQDSAIAMIDAQGVFHFINFRGAAPFGTPDFVVGKKLSDLFPPHIAEQQLAWVRQVLQTGQGLVIEYATQLAGKPSWRRVSIQPIRSADGSSELAMINSLDITERKQAEAKLAQSEEKYRGLSAALEERVLERTAEIEAIRQRLALATQIASLGVWDWNLKTGQLFWDDQVFAIYGVPKDTFQVSMETFLALVYPEDIPALQSFMQQAMQGGPSEQSIYRVKRGDGSLGYVKVHGAIQADAQGRPEHVIGVVQDITQDKLAENALRESQSRLKQINEELEAFSSSVSHDLRAPLRRIDSWATILVEDYQSALDKQGQEYLERVRGEVQLMNRITRDLLELARVTRSEMHMRLVPLSALARQITDRLRSETPDREPEVIIQPGISVVGDEHLLQIALTNLLDNAWKYTSKVENARIEFGVSATPEREVYFVRDNGAGFDMKYAQKLFGAFQRLHHASEFPGTGIGLATAQRIIRRHNGSIWAEAQVNRGAVFYFTLQASGE